MIFAIIIIKKLIEKIVYNTRKKEDKNLTISAESISKKFLDLCLWYQIEDSNA